MKLANLTFLTFATFLLMIACNASVEGEAKNQTVSESVSMPVIYVPTYPPVRIDTEPKIEQQSYIIQEEIESELKRPSIPGIELSEDLLDYIWNKSIKTDISYTLLLAIIEIESNYGKYKVNKNKNGTTDAGIIQINSSMVPFLSKQAGITKIDPMNDYHSIDMGIELLLYEREYFRSLGMSEEMVFEATIVGFNKGRSNTMKSIKDKTLNKQPYLKKVKDAKYKLEGMVES